jgi:hypothetical protein
MNFVQYNVFEVYSMGSVIAALSQFKITTKMFCAYIEGPENHERSVLDHPSVSLKISLKVPLEFLESSFRGL